MSFLNSLKSLFTPSEPAEATFPSEEYNGYTITPAPQSDGGQFRVCGVITKGDKTQQFIRADLMTSADACATETIRKAKLTIDQLGDGIFR